MFKIEQKEAITHIIFLFDKHKNHFPFEQRREIHNILKHINDIDDIIKNIRKEKEDILERLDQLDPELGDSFLESCHELIHKIIEAMEFEHEELASFKRHFKDHSFPEEDSMSSEGIIELEEIMEERYAERMLFWLSRFKKVAGDLYKDTKYSGLKKIIEKISQLTKLVKKLELDVEIEREKVRKEERDSLKEDMITQIESEHAHRMTKYHLSKKMERERKERQHHTEIRKLMTQGLRKW